jgi:hypothetical protein
MPSRFIALSGPRRSIVGPRNKLDNRVELSTIPSLPPNEPE